MIGISLNVGTTTHEDHAIFSRDNWMWYEAEHLSYELFTEYNYSFIHWAKGTRLSSNFVESYGVIIDYDDGSVTAEEIRDFLLEKNISYLILNSKSHRPDHHKFHVLLPFSKAISNPDIYQAYVFAAMELLPGTCDGVVKDLARFMGVTPKNKLQVYYQHYGNSFDVVVAPSSKQQKAIVQRHNEVRKEKSANFKCQVAFGGKWTATDDLIQLMADKQKHIISCPLNYGHKHGEDRTPSAYIDYSEKSNNWYIYCSVCSDLNGGRAFWMMPRDIRVTKKILEYKKKKGNRI